MYARDAIAIQRWAQESPANLLDVCAFVLCTIQTPLERAVSDFQSVKRLGARSPALWGSKRAGFTYLTRNIEAIAKAARQAVDAGDDVALLAAFVRVPGLGAPKAGFVAQLAYGRVGCLDSHNIRRFGLRAQDFATSGIIHGGPAFLRKLRLYIETCERLGGVRALWDDWCRYVPEHGRGGSARFLRLPVYAEERLQDAADVVSRLHSLAFGLEV